MDGGRPNIRLEKLSTFVNTLCGAKSLSICIAGFDGSVLEMDIPRAIKWCQEAISEGRQDDEINFWDWEWNGENLTILDMK